MQNLPPRLLHFNNLIKLLFQIGNAEMGDLEKPTPLILKLLETIFNYIEALHINEEELSTCLDHTLSVKNAFPIWHLLYSHNPTEADRVSILKELSKLFEDYDFSNYENPFDINLLLMHASTSLEFMFCFDMLEKMKGLQCEGLSILIKNYMKNIKATNDETLISRATNLISQTPSRSASAAMERRSASPITRPASAPPSQRSIFSPTPSKPLATASSSNILSISGEVFAKK